MNISFTGINNVNIKTTNTTEPVIFVSRYDGSEIKLDKNIQQIDLECDLSDDKNGRDLGDFYEAMYKSRKGV